SRGSSPFSVSSEMRHFVASGRSLFAVARRQRHRVAHRFSCLTCKFIVGTPKSHERRTVPFPELLEASLREARKDKSPTPLVLPAPDGRFMHNNTRGWFAGAVARSGAPG